MEQKSRLWNKVFTLGLLYLFLTPPAPGQARQQKAVENPRNKMPEYMSSYRSRKDDGSFVHAVLKNGITVIVEEYPASPVACIGSYVKAGYFDETDDIVGISHVLEHMFFKGTTKRSVGQIAKDTRALGGVLNASTIYDRTWYYSIVPAENLNKAMEIQADALQNSSLNGAELKKELEVIIQEAMRKLDSPKAFATEKLLELAFEKHRMRRWRIGAETGLRAIKREKLDQFYRDFYVPERIILVIVGDVQRDRVLEKVADLYGRFTRSPHPSTPSPEEPPQGGLRYGELRGDVQRSHLVLGYHTVGVEHPDYYPLLVLSQVLGAGRGSSFYQQLVDRQRLIDSYDVYQMSYPGVGMFMVDCTFDPSKVDRVEPAVLAEIELLRSRNLEAGELQRAVTLVEKGHYRSLENCESRAEQLGHFQALGDYKERERFVDRVRQVTPDQVREVAQKYLKLESLTIIEYQPRNAVLRSLDAAKLKGILEAAIPTALEKRRAETVTPQAAENTQKTTSRPTLEKTSSPLKRTSVLRGPEIYFKEDHTLPLVDVAFVFPGGRLEENDENRGITELALNVAVRESDHYRDGTLALAIERLGGTLQVINAPDYFGFVLSILSRNLREGVKVLTEVIQKPVFREETVSKEKELQLARLKRLKENNFTYPIQLCREALFGNHAYGLPSLGTEKSVVALSPQQLEAWHQQNVQQIKPLVVMLGDIEGTSVAEQFARDFSGSRFKERTVAERKVVPAAKPRRRSDTREIKQTALAIGFYGPAFLDHDSDVLDVIRNLVGGLGGRFFEELRDRQNLAYTVAVLNEKNRFGGAVYGYIATSPENAERAEKGLLSQFDGFKQEPIKDDEYYRALASTIGSHLISMQSRFYYLGEIIRHAMFGADAEQVDQYPSRIKSITIEEIKAAARKYFVEEKQAVGIVRAETQPAMTH
ncbi:MAG TPA: pitrilysin family protein [Acidobacteriota bacterium]|nr:pitrilysin family protein [Acidobacteriota bacterium]